MKINEKFIKKTKYIKTNKKHYISLSVIGNILINVIYHLPKISIHLEFKLTIRLNYEPKQYNNIIYSWLSVRKILYRQYYCRKAAESQFKIKFWMIVI